MKREIQLFTNSLHFLTCILTPHWYKNPHCCLESLFWISLTTYTFLLSTHRGSHSTLALLQHVFPPPVDVLNYYHFHWPISQTPTSLSTFREINDHFLLPCDTFRNLPSALLLISSKFLRNLVIVLWGFPCMDKWIFSCWFHNSLCLSLLTI